MHDVVADLLKLKDTVGVGDKISTWESLGEETTVQIARDRIINQGFAIRETQIDLGIPSKFPLVGLLVKYHGKKWYDGGKVYFEKNRRHRIGDENPNSDSTQYKFYHYCGDIFIGTRREFSEKYNIPRNSISKLVRGLLKSLFGWFLHPINQVEYDLLIENRKRAFGLYRKTHSARTKQPRTGFYINRFKRDNVIIYHWYNPHTVEHKFASVWEMNKKYKTKSFTGVKLGIVHSAHGYMIFEDGIDIESKCIVQLQSPPNVRYQFIHQTKGTICGTPKELAKIIGCSPSSISRRIQNKGKYGIHGKNNDSTYAWIFNGQESNPIENESISPYSYKKVRHKGKVVIRLSDGVVFDKMIDAAKAVNGESTAGSLSRAIKANRPYKGERFMFLSEYDKIADRPVLRP
jgi:hypothetical protein